MIYFFAIDTTNNVADPEVLLATAVYCLQGRQKGGADCRKSDYINVFGEQDEVSITADALIINIVTCPYMHHVNRWMQVTIVNETEFVLKFDDTSYQFRSGRYWAGAGNVEPNCESTFSVCNKAFGVAVNGSAVYNLAVSPECTVPVRIQYVNEFFGNIRLTANFMHGDNLSKETVVRVDGNYTKIFVSCAPGNHGKVTLFYEKEPQPAPSE